MLTKTRNITKDFILVVIVVVLGKILGFGRELVVSYLYGSSLITDAFYYVNSLITAAFSVITMGLAQAFMPIYTDLLVKEGKEEAKKFADKIIIILVTISIVVSILFCVFPRFLVSFLAPDMNGETRALASTMMNIMSWCIPIYTVFSIRKCILNANKKYIVTEASGIPYSVCIVLLTIVLYKASGNLALPIAAVVGVSFQFLFVFLFSKKDYLFSFNFRFKHDSNIKDYFLMMAPIALSVILEEANGLIRKSLAGGLGEGAIANLNYCMTLTALVNGIVITSITTVYYPHMIESFSKKDYDSFKKHTNDCLSLSSFILLPLVGFLFLCSKEVVQIVYERGAFTSNDTAVVSSLFSIYIIGSIFLLYRNIIKTAFFSAKNAKIPMINEIIYLILCITANILQIKVFKQGLDSLGISWVVSILLMTPILYFQFRKKYFSVINKKCLIEIIRITISSLVFVSLLMVLKRYVIRVDNKYLSVLLFFGISVSIYFLLMFLFKSENIKKILMLFRRKNNEEESNINN